MLVLQPVTLVFTQASKIKTKPMDGADGESVSEGHKIECIGFSDAPNGHMKISLGDESECRYVWPGHLDHDYIPPRLTLTPEAPKAGTFFKARPIGSSSLLETEKVLLSQGSELSVKSIGEVKGKHVEIELFEPIDGTKLKKGWAFVGGGTDNDPGHINITGWKHPGPYLLGDDLASKLIKYSLEKGYKIWDGPNELNIIYVEGMNVDGTLNSDKPNQWNDIRTIVEFVPDANGMKKPKFCFGPVKATTEPGFTYTYRKLNPNGAFRIQMGQWLEAWEVGLHNWKYDALVQVGRLCGHRDLNKDFSRVGDKIFCGSNFGVNQHHGGDAAVVGPYSAGCLVGQSVAQHWEFMRVCKLDSRYKRDRRFRFSSTVIDGSDLLRVVG